MPGSGPPSDCTLCPRLAALRADLRAQYPDWHNAPVPSFGAAHARLLIVGLAPGMKGANRTGRPFTGDYAGDLLYATLARYGFAGGDYGARADDGLALHDCRITNAVRCLPPQNKPVTDEIDECNTYLAYELACLPKHGVVLALGTIAHRAILKARGVRLSKYPFAHAAHHRFDDGRVLIDSYHCSRYNTQTRRLTTDMFRAVFRAVRLALERDAS